MSTPSVAKSSSVSRSSTGGSLPSLASARSTATTSGAVEPSPKPSTSRACASFVVEPAGVLLASGKPRSSVSAGADSPSSRPNPRTADSTGRACTARLHRRQTGPSARPGPQPGQPPGVHPPAEHPEQRRQQRDRRQHHDRHRDHRRDGGAGHVAQAHRAQPEQRDDDGAAGDEHRPARGLDGADHGVGRVLTRRQRLPVAAHHEQHVVDADTDPDHRGHGGRPLGDVQDPRQQPDQAGADPDADQRDAERQAGRDDGAEGDDEDDGRGDDADDLTGAGLRLLRELHDLAGERDLHAVAGGLLGQLLERDDVLDGHVVDDRPAEADLRYAGAPVVGQPQVRLVDV